jgi:predicted  nucleic acid-binding Zn-ribbon protein
MKKVMEPLLALQALELDPARETPEKAGEIARLRQSIPAQIIGHYDRLMVRGKKGVALVRHGVCSECHMRMSSGSFSQLLREEDIMVCESCGRYLYPVHDAPASESAPAPEEAPKKARKRAKKKENGPIEAPAL